jgi:hypothetical protein
MGALIIYRGFSINCARTNAPIRENAFWTSLRCMTITRAVNSATTARSTCNSGATAPRSLWDPSYVDESWINDRVQLIPHLKNSVTTYYPGRLIGITKYNWGAENHINGAART